MKGFIQNMNGWKKSKGVTLVELIAVMAISLIIMAISSTLIVSGIKSIMELYSVIEYSCDIDDALITIEAALDGEKINEIKYYTGLNSKIIIDSDEGNGKVRKRNTVIFLDDNKLKIKREKYFVLSGNVDSSGINTVLNKVEAFEITEKDKLYYMYIRHSSGMERIICL